MNTKQRHPRKLNTDCTILSIAEVNVSSVSLVQYFEILRQRRRPTKVPHVSFAVPALVDSQFYFLFSFHQHQKLVAKLVLRWWLRVETLFDKMWIQCTMRHDMSWYWKLCMGSFCQLTFWSKSAILFRSPFSHSCLTNSGQDKSFLLTFGATILLMRAFAARRRSICRAAWVTKHGM